MSTSHISGAIIHVLLFTQHFPPDTGAHATRCSWLSREMLARGHRVTVVVPRWANHPVRVSDHSGLVIHEVRALVPGMGLGRRLLNEALASVQMLARATKVHDVDAVAATVPALLTLPTGWLASRLLRAPMVLELRDAWPHLLSEMDQWGEDGTQPATAPRRLVGAGAKVLTTVMWWLERRAAGTVVTSQSLARDLQGKVREPVRLARNVNAHALVVAPRERDHAELRVLYLGSVGRAQRLATAVQAALLVQQRGVPITLRILGKGAHVAAIDEYIQRTGAPVQLLPPIPITEVAAQYSWSDTVLIMLRDWSAMRLTVPSKLYEVLATGRHITGSVAGETADIITDAQAGHVVAPQDPVALADLWCRLAEDRALLDVSDGGHQWLAEHADRGQQAQSVEDVLRTVVDAHVTKSRRGRWGRSR